MQGTRDGTARAANGLATIDRVDPEADRVHRHRVELAAAFRAAARYGFSEGIDNHFSLLVGDQTRPVPVEPLRTGLVRAVGERPALARRRWEGHRRWGTAGAHRVRHPSRCPPREGRTPAVYCTPICPMPQRSA